MMITHTDADEWVDYLRVRLRERLGVQDVPAVRSGAVSRRTSASGRCRWPCVGWWAPTSRRVARSEVAAGGLAGLA